MKQTVKITFCAIMAAMATAFMLLAYFPYFTYAVPAIAGVLTLVVLIELRGKWPIFTYIVTSVLVFLFAEVEAKFMYISFFGYYPLLKAVIEKINNRVVQYLLKFAVFNAAVLLVYGILASLIGIDVSEFGSYGTIGMVGMLVLANVAFFLYDIVLVRVANMYLKTVHPRLKKVIK
ncbi:MAG: hypothetical protein J6S00_03630 [Clostridia bacterium]|nr:hypothetical protein [Clostridia bacterium]